MLLGLYFTVLPLIYHTSIQENRPSVAKTTFCWACVLSANMQLYCKISQVIGANIRCIIILNSFSDTMARETCKFYIYVVGNFFLQVNLIFT